MVEKLKEEVEKAINGLLEDGVQGPKLDELYKLVDIHKDLSNEQYWKKKEEVMENEIQRVRGIW